MLGYISGTVSIRAVSRLERQGRSVVGLQIIMFWRPFSVYLTSRRTVNRKAATPMTREQRGIGHAKTRKKSRRSQTLAIRIAKPMTHNKVPNSKLRLLLATFWKRNSPQKVIFGPKWWFGWLIWLATFGSWAGPTSSASRHSPSSTSSGRVTVLSKNAPGWTSEMNSTRPSFSRCGSQGPFAGLSPTSEYFYWDNHWPCYPASTSSPCSWAGGPSSISMNTRSRLRRSAESRGPLNGKTLRLVEICNYLFKIWS